MNDEELREQLSELCMMGKHFRYPRAGHHERRRTA